MTPAGPRPVRIGMLTPSSNTMLEPVTMAIAAGLPDVTVHFSRFKVTEIALSEQALGQFDLPEIVRAAELLAHAKVDVIAWNGTSASWLGIDRDELLCSKIRDATGIVATSSTLALHHALGCFGARKVGLVTPYTDDVQRRIQHVWGRAGFDCRIERHLGWRDNFSFCEASEATIAGMVRDVADAGCDAVAIVCTNMNGSKVAVELEAECGIPVLDSITVTLWKTLCLAGVDPVSAKAWGSVFVHDVRQIAR